MHLPGGKNPNGPTGHVGPSSQVNLDGLLITEKRSLKSTFQQRRGTNSEFLSLWRRTAASYRTGKVPPPQNWYSVCSENRNGLSSTHCRSLTRRARRSSSTSLRECSRAACCSARFSARFRLSHLHRATGRRERAAGLGPEREVERGLTV